MLDKIDPYHGDDTNTRQTEYQCLDCVLVQLYMQMYTIQRDIWLIVDNTNSVFKILFLYAKFMLLFLSTLLQKWLVCWLFWFHVQVCNEPLED